MRCDVVMGTQWYVMYHSKGGGDVSVLLKTGQVFLESPSLSCSLLKRFMQVNLSQQKF
jgi:hypothetical protein